MKKRLIVSIFLITTLLINVTGTAYALTWWDVVVNNAVTNPIGWIFNIYNAMQWLANYVGSLGEVANWCYARTKASLATAGGRYISYLYTVMNGSERVFRKNTTTL